MQNVTRRIYYRNILLEAAGPQHKRNDIFFTYAVYIVFRNAALYFAGSVWTTRSRNNIPVTHAESIIRERGDNNLPLLTYHRCNFLRNPFSGFVDSYVDDVISRTPAEFENSARKVSCVYHSETDQEQ